MAKISDIELSMRRKEAGFFSVDLKSSPADSDSDERVSAEIQLDVEALKTLDTIEYGRALGTALFGVEALRDALTRARAQAQSAQAALRLRLFVHEDSAELHAVRWELMRDAAGEEMFHGAQCWFSRYLSSPNWRPVQSRTAHDLKALVVIASPSELEQKPNGMSPLPVAREKAWAEKSLSGIAVTHLTSGEKDAGRNPTLSSISAQLRNGFDIVFLICHGAFSKTGKQPLLWLENEQGNADVVEGARFAGVVQGLAALPRLVVLASCESAGSGVAEDALAALGPKLAEAGVPAVVAMQGKVAVETIDEFMPVFLAELRRDGLIDRAMAVARGDAHAKKRKDYWIPVLFMRLRSGSLWHKPGFAEIAGGRGEFERWATIKGAIEDRQCTPILGPGLVENLLGSPRSLAHTLAQRFRFPMSPSALEDLPAVAQYLAVNQGNTISPRREMRKSIGQGLIDRFGSNLGSVDPADLNLLISEAGKLQRRDGTIDPHAVLARKPFPIYLTVNADNLMEDALVEAKRTPRSEFARWNEKIADVRRHPTLRDREPDYRPSVENPLVYHLYGQLSVPESLVVTEDDYFDYLLRIGSKADGKSLTPGPVGTALTADALLFIGFRLEDWSFRVLLRSIYSKEGSGARSIGSDTLPCVGAQMMPEEDRILRPDGARKYFEQYLRSSNIDIFWGSVDDFVAELDKQTPSLAGAAAA